MNESEIAELFNKELDALLQEGGERSFGPDRGAMALAGELVRADFSGQSLIKESLRKRLAGSEAGGFLDSLHLLFSNNFARAALAAAVLVIALLPLARRHAGRAPELMPVTGIVRLPVQAQALRPGAAASRLPAALEPSQNPPEGGLFASIPMARLEAEPIKNFPIVLAETGSPILVAEGREVKLENGSGIVFRTCEGVFALERRAVTPEDLFERRVI